MKNSMGMDSQALVREARKAWRPRVAASAGGVPASVPWMTFLLLGQMMPQTLSSMTRPMPPPIPMASRRLLSQPWELRERKSQLAASTSTAMMAARTGPWLSPTTLMSTYSMAKTAIQMAKKLPKAVAGLAAPLLASVEP